MQFRRSEQEPNHQQLLPTLDEEILAPLQKLITDDGELVSARSADEIAVELPYKELQALVGSLEISDLDQDTQDFIFACEKDLELERYFTATVGLGLSSVLFFAVMTITSAENASEAVHVFNNIAKLMALLTFLPYLATRLMYLGKTGSDLMDEQKKYGVIVKSQLRNLFGPQAHYSLYKAEVTVNRASRELRRQIHASRRKIADDAEKKANEELLERYRSRTSAMALEKRKMDSED